MWVASLCPWLGDRQAVGSRESLFLLVTSGSRVPEQKASELHVAPCQPPGLRSEMGHRVQLGTRALSPSREKRLQSPSGRVGPCHPLCHSPRLQSCAARAPSVSCPRANPPNLNTDEFKCDEHSRSCSNDCTSMPAVPGWREASVTWTAMAIASPDGGACSEWKRKVPIEAQTWQSWAGQRGRQAPQSAKSPFPRKGPCVPRLAGVSSGHVLNPAGT